MGIGSRVDEVKKADDSKIKKTSNIDFSLVDSKYTLESLVVSESAINQIKKALAFREYDNILFNTWGLSKTHSYSKRVSINFYGPPGTGKTMAAHAVADYLGKKLLIVNYADIESKFVGETPKNLVAAFEYAKNNDAIIFFDEADAMLSKRVTNMSSSTDTSVNQTRSILLNIMNEYDKTILFSTNFIENFDSAFLRRILVHIKFELPDMECRRKLFNSYIPQEMPHTIDLDEVAALSDGLSGSDISNSILLAALSAAQRRSDYVEMLDVQDAISSTLKSRQDHAKKHSVTKRELTQQEVQEKIGEIA